MAIRFSRRSFIKASATLPVGLVLGQGAARAEPAPVKSGKADLVVGRAATHHDR
jgi:hypothetical protein